MWRLFGIDFLFVLVFNILCGEEETVVEINNPAGGTVVDVEVFHVNLILMKQTLDTVEKSPVAVAPPIDTLLHVADDEVGPAAHGLIEQYAEVLPLNVAGVLELVYHDVFQLGTHLFKDER